MKKLWNYLRHSLYPHRFITTMVVDMIGDARHLTMFADNYVDRQYQDVGLRLSDPSVLDGPKRCYLRKLVADAWACGYDPSTFIFPNGKAIVVPLKYRREAALRYGVYPTPAIDAHL